MGQEITEGPHATTSRDDDIGNIIDSEVDSYLSSALGDPILRSSTERMTHTNRWRTMSQEITVSIDPSSPYTHLTSTPSPHASVSIYPSVSSTKNSIAVTMSRSSTTNPSKNNPTHTEEPIPPAVHAAMSKNSTLGLILCTTLIGFPVVIFFLFKLRKRDKYRNLSNYLFRGRKFYKLLRLSDRIDDCVERS